MIEDYFVILFLYLLMGCLFAWNTVKGFFDKTKRQLNWVEILIINLVFMAFWPLILVYAFIPRR